MKRSVVLLFSRLALAGSVWLVHVVSVVRPPKPKGKDDHDHEKPV